MKWGNTLQFDVLKRLLFGGPTSQRHSGAWCTHLMCVTVPVYLVDIPIQAHWQKDEFFTRKKISERAAAEKVKRATTRTSTPA